MKHIHALSKHVPAKALLGIDHPGILASILGLLRDPIDVIEFHLKKDDGNS